MALQMKDRCERCGAMLAMDFGEARICSYECTFCRNCSEDMNSACPNCGGKLKPRPRRVKRE